ncbi:MAG: SRPBCC family protein [Prevotella sp.]|nr:SRPBCC family protein [Prevotella sp.]
MSSKFESGVRQIPYAQEKVYKMLSDLNNLEKVRERLPEDKVKDLVFDTDSVSISVPPVGQVALRIIEREEPKCIKFETEKSPVAANLWIQLLPVTADSCKMKLTIKADINPFIKGMVAKPLQEGLEKIAETLSVIRYE